VPAALNAPPAAVAAIVPTVKVTGSNTAPRAASP
jgi:hypothetical protein